ncbi:RTA1 like protein-domain-containing protein [Stachybotrys elegans]|uniref:RTA1 like protein-domain-containing protein n=1 Tax=Stachybotrys elegans TaxID=80388 RepID=A0A8K0WU20_9HYPO|nr:RTA1 like protein-domain-containing protein [Stachybotrys elegans]
MSHLPQLPNGLIAFGPLANCTLELCPLEASVLHYQPYVGASAAFIAAFALCLFAHVAQGVYYRTWGFMSCMVAGCILEVLGYGGRIIIHDNPFDFSGFLMQIICITVSPVFFCSAIYVLLSQVINKVDRSISRFSPKLFYCVFIPVDIISLVLQAVGGAFSSTASNVDAVQVGVNISLAGLVFQVFTLLAFCTLFVDYLLLCRKSPSWPLIDKPMRFFLTFFFLSIALILLRCIYRIVELHDGYFSHWFRDQDLFIVFESVIMCLAVICLNVGHPGPVLSGKRNSGDDKNGETTETAEA